MNGLQSVIFYLINWLLNTAKQTYGVQSLKEALATIKVSVFFTNPF
ncbi:hypothetical protein GNIT_2638 [Glaciecola nitratireducens FR1064]|uniref:Uncharacterized protein n=1 Tax=Glaciecola nitratireducens (strain JCM 12485 / KCTC 12276 / FR1064) TaxID=1085623 RepID=G4QM83_GLANF|nr:hypothetical protein GNIT_2638 [Glaciecola nitratireducens FR1064]